VIAVRLRREGTVARAIFIGSFFSQDEKSLNRPRIFDDKYLLDNLQDLAFRTGKNS
jgi:hypothetical protein